MELEILSIDLKANRWDVKRAIGSLLHSTEFYNPTDPKARPM